jgi:glycosyltransferase involved in cell wall biosynthesis
MGVPAVNSFHDFYTICPTVNLIDDKGEFYPTGVTSQAKNPLWDDKTVFDYTLASSNRWKAKMSLALSLANAYVTTCESAKSILLDALPDVFVNKSPDSFSVFPHGRDFDEFYQYAEAPVQGKPLKVLLPGNISLSKGAETVKAIKKLDVEGLIEFHVLGTCISDLIPYVKCHGAYDRGEFHEKVKAIRPHIAAVLSIWPETYCHTLTESWACGIPVLGVNLGAVGARITEHGGGWLTENDPQQVYQQLVNIDLVSWETQIESTIEWQSHYGADNTIASMATKYIGLYNNILHQQRSEIPHYVKKVGLVIKGEFPNVPPTAYVRIVDWLDYFKARYLGECEFINGNHISKVNFSEYKQLIVQRDSIPNKHIDSFIEATKRSDIRLCLELDDDLLNVPVSIDSTGVYAQYRTSILKLIKSAHEIHVTNDTLAETCRLYNQSVEIRENKLLKARWFDAPICSQEPPFEWQENKLNIVYFGSRTHTEDYQFLLESLDKAIKLGAELKLYVIGVTSEREDKPNFVEYLDPPSDRFDIFVDWLRGYADYFDLGVAPLMDTDFNRSKSHLKVLEYLALGLPVLCSDVEAYKKMTLKSAVNLLENDINIWADAIHRFEKVSVFNLELDDYFIENES